MYATSDVMSADEQGLGVWKTVTRHSDNKVQLAWNYDITSTNNRD